MGREVLSGIALRMLLFGDAGTRDGEVGEIRLSKDRNDAEAAAIGASVLMMRRRRLGAGLHGAVEGSSSPFDAASSRRYAK